MFTVTLSQQFLQTAIDVLPLPSGVAETPMMNIQWAINTIALHLTEDQFLVQGIAHISAPRSLLAVDSHVAFTAVMDVEIEEQQLTIACRDMTIGSVPVIKDMLGSIIKPKLRFTILLPDIPPLTIPLMGDQNIELMPVVSIAEVSIREGSMLITGLIHIGVLKKDDPQLFRIRGSVTVSSA